MKNWRIVVTPGDGIGPEVMAAGAEVLDHTASRFGVGVTQLERPLGGNSIDRFGEPCTDEVMQDALDADAVFLAAVGGPKWDDPHAEFTPEEGVLRLRKGLELYANVRPVRVYDALVDQSPLRPEVVRGTDMVILRELTGGLYFGQPKEMRFIGGERGAVDTLAYRESEIRRIVERAFEWAAGRRRKVLSVDKFNVLVTGRFWRDIANDIAAQHPDIEYDTMLADACAAALVRQPTAYDVIVTENTFGDLLSDEAGVFHRLAGHVALRQSGRRRSRALRARARQRAGHRGPGHCQPVGYNPQRGDAVSPHVRPAAGGRGNRVGRRTHTQRRVPNARYRRGGCAPRGHTVHDRGGHCPHRGPRRRLTGVFNVLREAGEPTRA